MKASSRTLNIGLALVSAGVVLSVAAPPAVAATLTPRVSAWLPPWDQSRGLASFQAQADQYRELSPFWYGITTSGAIESYSGAGSSTVVNAAATANVPLVPSIDNGGDGARVSAMLADATRRSNHVTAIAQLVSQNGYAGIDIDYEGLPASDRSLFTTFVQQTAAAIHGAGKMLIVTVHPKTSEPGSWSGPQAQDYAAIGAVADVVRVMAYDYSWSGSAPGPVAPLGWVDDVAAFASSVIPASKLELGLPLYGYDWGGSGGVGVTYDNVQALLAKHSPTIQWSSTHAESWFTYSESGVTHTVWFSDSRSVEERLGVVTGRALRGVVFWRLGGEDPGVWSKTRSAFGGGTAPDTTAPAVAILSPKPNAKLTVPSQRIDYTSSDDHGVVLVRLYLDSALVSTATTAIGAFVLTTKYLKPGKHLLTVQAVDATGNARSANAYVRR